MATELTWAFACLSSLKVHFSFEGVKGTYKRKEKNKIPMLVLKIMARFIVKTWIFLRLNNWKNQGCAKRDGTEGVWQLITEVYTNSRIKGFCKKFVPYTSPHKSMISSERKKACKQSTLEEWSYAIGGNMVTSAFFTLYGG